MTALAVARRPGSGTVARLGLLGLFVALVTVLFLTGVLPAARWQPFLDPTTWRALGFGLLVTLQIGLTALVLSLGLGIPLGMARAGLTGPGRWIVSLWVEAIRATPVLAILFIAYLGISRLGIDLNTFQAAVVGLTVYNSAILGEIVRAGIGSIPRGEVDAARSLGLSYGRTMRHVVLPQALSRMTPAIVSQLITLVKDTSLAFIIGAQELVGAGRSVFVGFGNVLETYIVIACLFFAINYPLSRISRRLEARQPAEERVAVAGEEDQIAVEPAPAVVPVGAVEPAPAPEKP
jgi:glutamate transport system permease protein